MPSNPVCSPRRSPAISLIGADIEFSGDASHPSFHFSAFAFRFSLGLSDANIHATSVLALSILIKPVLVKHCVDLVQAFFGILLEDGSLLE
jgi:hypothetical protein